jgi:hypothetical protein
MGRNGLALFSGLALAGAASGYLMGELILGSGNGLYVAPVAAVIGLLLAWALWNTRAGGEPGPVPPSMSKPSPEVPQARQRKNTVRVAKSPPGGKRR